MEEIEGAIRKVFSYHRPTEPQVDALTEIREAAKRFALLIAEKCPKSADRSVAIRCIREAVMNANASIVLDGVSPR